ncbi:MAG TPA: endonuclease MutS2 [Dissulfurispiraceae bacterium]|nr:endonuclease MutS2 [Dissulfurispiraceae bacterium]
MISPQTLSLLEFDKLLTITAGFANSGASQAAAAKLAPFSDPQEVRLRQALIRDILLLSSQGIDLALSPFPDISGLFAKVRPDGAVLEAVELAGFTPVLEIIFEISGQLNSRDDVPHLCRMAEGLTGFPDILKVLKRSVDSEGSILDNASPALAEIRRDIRRLEARIRKKLEDMTRSENVSIFLQDDFVTTRSGRWVLPVRMDSKGQVAGVVHDVSKSGETAFVEPIAIIGLSNELENLTAEEKAEEIRILRSISSRIRESLEAIEGQFEILVYIDVLNCIARLALLLKMELPAINDTGIINVVNGRHPLLSLSFRRYGTGRQVVPLSVRLGGGDTVMVITGSNAGGKTISIKTIGLLTLMALAGMPVPADSSSSFPMISDMLIDIGDEQSIENDQSTFSAHIVHISEILKKAGPTSIVLLDELGTGTDPVEGAALACAVLNEIKERGALLFATTHLTDIKGFVHRTQGMLNASMEFDQDTLTPLYTLRIGEPGQSHAIEIARRYGLPDSVVDSAKALMGGVRVEFDNLIRDLTEKRSYYENAVVEIDRQKTDIDEKQKALDGMISEARRESDALMIKARSDALELAGSVKRELYALLEAAKKAEKEKIRESLKVAEKKQKELDRELSACLPDDSEDVTIDTVREGDIVFVSSIDDDAQVSVVDRRRERLSVKYGSVEIEVPFSAVRKRKGKSAHGGKQGQPQVQAEVQGATATLNIIGLRADDALSRIEPFLNHAALAGLRQVVIIHGIGGGVLIKVVKEQLTGHPLVAGFRSGEQQEGGRGVTVVSFK